MFQLGATQQGVGGYIGSGPGSVTDWLDRNNGNFLSSISQAWNGGSERGVDIGWLPMGTPIYSIVPMNNTKQGYYWGGGVVSGDTIINGQKQRIYYQHFDQIANGIGDGQVIPAGTLLGYSGGQCFGGHHPDTQLNCVASGGGPHMEIGINPHFGGIWGADLGPNVNPVPWLQSVLSGNNHEDYTPVSGPNCNVPTFFGVNPCTPGTVGSSAIDNAPPPCPWKDVPILGPFYCLGYNGYNSVTGIASTATKDPLAAFSAVLGGLVGKVLVFALGLFLLWLGFRLLFGSSGDIGAGAIDKLAGALEKSQSAAPSPAAGEGAPAPSPVGQGAPQAKQKSTVASRAHNAEVITKAAVAA